MTWRDKLLAQIGPGLLGGITLGQWLRLLSENGWRVAPGHLARAAAITASACSISPAAAWERWKYRDQIRDIEIPPPVFVLGHWRSGTTHLHNLLTLDPRFAYPNNYQCLLPHTFLTSEASGSWLMSLLLSPRRPMDNVEWNVESPQEDEFALNGICFCSPYMGWTFPRRREHYDRYLTMQDISAAEVERWREALLHFMRKLTLKYGRPLVLKSPPHTARIRLLLETFPQARFVHIHRDPYAVFQSTRKMLAINMRMHSLQPPPVGDLDEWILRQYRAMHEAYFAERDLIPAGQLHELSFSALESDPLEQLRQVYDRLSLPDFAAVEAPREYLASIADYRKNEFAVLDDANRRRVAEAAQPCLAEWGYEKG